MLILLFLIFYDVFCENITIIAASKNENVTWLHEMMRTLPEGHDLKIYRPNEPNYKYTTKYEKGFETCMYLRYIIDYYYELPDYMIFIHAHESSWHMKDMKMTIPRINYNNLTYKNLNYIFFQRVSILSEHKYVLYNIYPELFPNRKIQYIDTYCCAQFVVNKNLVLRNRLEFYIYLDNWLMDTNHTNYYSSRAIEYMWFYIFNGYENDTPYPNALCSIIQCTKTELQNKNYNFMLKYNPKSLPYYKIDY